ncbi:MAG: YjbQ family protein [Actinobacteria bacterium]|jgi:secondary thiamine-phosphate synthase enzyme|nr:YjbQ family protein [Actinomycetota bacterium]
MKHETVNTDCAPRTRQREGLVRVVTEYIELATPGNAHIARITDQVKAALAHTGLLDGTLTVFAPGATGAVTTIEFEPGVVADVQKLFDTIVPPGKHYQHNVNLGDGNGHSHVRAGLLGPSLTIPFVDGVMTLGRWQEIVFVDFDARPRERRLVVQMLGV